MGGLAGALMGDGMIQEIEKRMKMITNELCPRMDSLIIEQRKTNEKLDEIAEILRSISNLLSSK